MVFVLEQYLPLYLKAAPSHPLIRKSANEVVNTSRSRGGLWEPLIICSALFEIED